jgi:hypothetical protein
MLFSYVTYIIILLIEDVLSGSLVKMDWRFQGKTKKSDYLLKMPLQIIIAPTSVH